MLQEIRERLADLTMKEAIILVDRGNTALLHALRHAASLGKKSVLVQDQGGWLTYLHYPEKFVMAVVKVKTHYGIMDVDDLKEKATSHAVLLINSMPGYIAYEDMKLITNLCKENNTIIINDVSGSIGSAQATFGDIIVGSFGKWKPIHAAYGGFIAGGEINVKENFDEERLRELLQNLHNLEQTIQNFKTKAEKIKNDLTGFNIIHKNKEGFNVAVRFGNNQEKEKIIAYCHDNNLPYTLCPRYIRVHEDAISIEVKRI